MPKKPLIQSIKRRHLYQLAQDYLSKATISSFLTLMKPTSIYINGRTSNICNCRVTAIQIGQHCIHCFHSIRCRRTMAWGLFKNILTGNQAFTVRQYWRHSLFHTSSIYSRKRIRYSHNGNNHKPTNFFSCQPYSSVDWIIPYIIYRFFRSKITFIS